MRSNDSLLAFASGAEHSDETAGASPRLHALLPASKGAGNAHAEQRHWLRTATYAAVAILRKVSRRTPPSSRENARGKRCRVG